MEPGFSETTFSHAVYGELIRSLRCFRPPHLPSTVEEFYVPYDLEWSLSARRSLFIQFKVSEYLDHPRAKEKLDVGCPYFRFRLHQSHGACSQHNLLKDLSDTFPHDVYYVAPLFHKYDEYVRLFAPPAIVPNSIFIDLHPMSQFADSDRHCVVYNSSRVLERSESREIGDVVTGDEFLRRLKPEFGIEEERPPVIDNEKLSKTVEHLENSRDSLLRVLHARDIRPIAFEPRFYDYYPWRPFWRGFDVPPELISRLVYLAAEINDLAHRFFGVYWIGLG